MVNIIPFENIYSNEEIQKGFTNLCIKILNEIMARRRA
jgi:hypothetical protein